MLVRLGPQPTCGPGTRELPRRECSDRDEGVDIGRTFVQLALGLAALGLACSSASSAAATAAPRGLPPSWLRVRSGPAGGAVWIGHIPNAVVPEDQRLSAVYLPPGYTATRRYPVVYLLHGLPGSASSFYDSLPIARVADTLISAGQAQPFIAVMPTGGPLTDQGDGEWAGVWERWLTEQVIPWVDSHLATQPSAAGRPRRLVRRRLRRDRHRPPPSGSVFDTRVVGGLLRTGVSRRSLPRRKRGVCRCPYAEASRPRAGGHIVGGGRALFHFGRR